MEKNMENSEDIWHDNGKYPTMNEDASAYPIKNGNFPITMLVFGGVTSVKIKTALLGLSQVSPDISGT